MAEDANIQRAPAAGRRILVVDDALDIAELFAMMLGEMGHEVQIAVSAGEALARIAENPPEIIFSDLSMPVMSGCQFARKVRADPALRNILLIAVSGYGEPKDRQEARDAGFDHHLLKPADGEMLKKLFDMIAAGSPTADGIGSPPV